jgi:hypothetical protein
MDHIAGHSDSGVAGGKPSSVCTKQSAAKGRSLHGSPWRIASTCDPRAAEGGESCPGDLGNLQPALAILGETDHRSGGSLAEVQTEVAHSTALP